MKKYSFTFITLLSVVLYKDDQDADNDPRNGSKWELVSDSYEVLFTNPVDVSGYDFKILLAPQLIIWILTFPPGTPYWVATNGWHFIKQNIIYQIFPNHQFLLC